MNQITQLLQGIARGDGDASAELLPLVYAELRRLAAHKMAHEAAGHTLQPTALVHEAWLRLGGDAQPQWQNRAHFFAAAAAIVKVRFFTGITVEEAGLALGVTERTARRYWRFARAWLHDRLGPQSEPGKAV
jgi:DNA-directed RNA polymerase specialized sigma24 family protein